MTPVTCPSCHQAVPETARFCPACGASLGPRRADLSRYMPWALSGALALVLVVLALQGKSSPPAAPAGEAPAGPVAGGNAGGGAPPDISNMSPQQRFDRLYQRIITAAQSGDQGTVTQFMPMAVAAFGMLDSVTVDARYHMAMLRLHVGDMAGASAQADSIRRMDPDHLFSYVIAAAVGRWNKNDSARDAAYREFLKRYDAQMAKGKAEYQEHKAMLEEVRQAATAGKAAG